jgi:hypothetical protein
MIDANKQTLRDEIKTFQEGDVWVARIESTLTPPRTGIPFQYIPHSAEGISREAALQELLVICRSNCLHAYTACLKRILEEGEK